MLVGNFLVRVSNIFLILHLHSHHYVVVMAFEGKWVPSHVADCIGATWTMPRWFLLDGWFCEAILLKLSTLIRYWWLGRVSMTLPIESHQWLVGFCIETMSSFWSGHRVWAVRLYLSIRQVLCQALLVILSWGYLSCMQLVQHGLGWYEITQPAVE